MGSTAPSTGREARETMLDVLDRNAEDHPGVTALVDGDRVLNWSQYRRRARAIALALLDLGVSRGDVVGLHMGNRAEHLLADMGVLTAGAVPTSFFRGIATDELVYLARDCAASVVIVDAGQLRHWQSIREQLPALRHLVVLDLAPDEPAPDGVIRFEKWIEDADDQLADRDAEVAEARASVVPDDVLTIAYTSGTTGPPKGAIVTHAGARWLLDGLSDQIADHLGGVIPVGWTTVSYLPLAHLGERMFSHYLGLVQTITVTYVRDMAKLPALLPSVRPYLFFGPPKAYQQLHDIVRAHIAGATNPVYRMVGRLALSVAEAAGAATLNQVEPCLPTRILHPIMERLVYAGIRARLGLDRHVLAVTSSASMCPNLSSFYTGLGLALVDVYGSCDGGMLAMSPLDAPRPGTVGRAWPGVELTIAPDGEILARGPNITPGYLNRPDATSTAIDDDGWFHTGDVGSLDDDGYLRILGRTSDMITTESGERVSPDYVERVLAHSSDLIGSVFVHGAEPPGLVALVTLDPLTWESWCVERGIEVSGPEEASVEEQVLDEVAGVIAAGNATLPASHQVGNWTLLGALWSTRSGELTPTQRLRRPVILDRYRAEIERLAPVPKV
ncbi:AMP-dependent synthetase/ligase [Pseudonocardia spinosispora]|uniref:AMP-dependent synthetase/ligase n=1 Tax=Pseudonocardia spinosispora TaxID=103441 RepID=UPI00041E1A1A|nr:AMP-binding protein [Pseudonocardia spinosispora]